MIWQTTNGITIEIASRFEEGHSQPTNKKFVHSYQVNIINDNDHAVQLLRRHWFIHDSDQTIREVEGDGVIGVQPIIKPEGNHTYMSWSVLQTAIGKMSGNYSMLNLETQKEYKVEIPEFPLVANFKLN